MCVMLRVIHNLVTLIYVGKHFHGYGCGDMDKVVKVRRSSGDGGIVELYIPYETENDKRKIYADLGFTVGGQPAPLEVTRRGKGTPAKAERIAQYLEGEKGGDFAHSFPEIGRKFYGENFRASSDNAEYIKLRSQILEAHEILRKKHGGHWEKTNAPDSKKVKIFKLVK